MNRRQWLAATGAATVCARSSAGWSQPAAGELRVGLTAVILDDQAAFLREWRSWLSDRLGRPVSFVRRGSYRDIVDLLRSDRLDIAWLCGFPYLRYRRDLRLVAMPLWRGRQTYQSYLIVPAEDRRTDAIEALRGKVFAFSDPDSNSGFLWPRYRVLIGGHAQEGFFSRTFFTWAHRAVVEAVGAGLAAGGAVDGYVWEVLATIQPALTGQTRIVERSWEMGYPPIVARANLALKESEAFFDVLASMRGDEAGGRLLGMLRLDGFARPQPGIFDSIQEMMRATGVSA